MANRSKSYTLSLQKMARVENLKFGHRLLQPGTVEGPPVVALKTSLSPEEDPTCQRFLLLILNTWGFLSCCKLPVDEETRPKKVHFCKTYGDNALWKRSSSPVTVERWGKIPHPQYCMLYIVIYRAALVEFGVSHLERRQKQVLILHQNILSLL